MEGLFKEKKETMFWEGKGLGVGRKLGVSMSRSDGHINLSLPPLCKAWIERVLLKRSKDLPQLAIPDMACHAVGGQVQPPPKTPGQTSTH